MSVAVPGTDWHLCKVSLPLTCVSCRSWFLGLKAENRPGPGVEAAKEHRGEGEKLPTAADSDQVSHQVHIKTAASCLLSKSPSEPLLQPTLTGKYSKGILENKV